MKEQWVIFKLDDCDFALTTTQAKLSVLLSATTERIQVLKKFPVEGDPVDDYDRAKKVYEAFIKDYPQGVTP